MTKQGFDIHHVDGDHDNNDPDNLVLIERYDHLRLHGRPPADPSYIGKCGLEYALQKGRSCYELRSAGGISWDDVARKVYGRRRGQKAIQAAKRYARYHGLVWPIQVDPVRREHYGEFSKGARAYELRKSGMTWRDVSIEVWGKPCQERAMRMARKHAKRRGFPWPISRPRKKKPPREPKEREPKPLLETKAGRAYKMRASGATWPDVGREIWGDPCAQRAYKQTRRIAERRGLPWPIPT
jgi:hypothetical protein